MTISIEVLIGICAVLVITYLIRATMLKDTYYGVGEISALQSQCGNLIEYEKGGMSLKVSDTYTVTYIGHLADSVYAAMCNQGLQFKFKPSISKTASP